MDWIGVIIIGLLAGVIAKMLMPGRDPGGFFITILLGIAGALLAAWLGGALNVYDPVTSGFMGRLVAAVIGALIILILYRLIRRPRT